MLELTQNKKFMCVSLERIKIKNTRSWLHKKIKKLQFNMNLDFFFSDELSFFFFFYIINKFAKK